ncbi:MAG: proline dehydrogenase family protein, partial [Actinomycetes bacterium]
STPSPSFLGRADRLALRAGAALAEAIPGVVLALVRQRVRAEFAGVVQPAEDRAFARHARRRRRQGIRLNVNVLGEAILGDEEAGRRLDAVLAQLERPDVDYVSVKISSICAQLNVIAFDHEVDRFASRLRVLYDAALAHDPPKFVNLDMEEYADLGLTLAVFRRVLEEGAYAGLDAGVVLQAYVPDSLPALVELCAWARERRRRGGGRTKIRIVKGANLAMEQVEAELAVWPQAPFDTKAEVDAHYKRMLDVLLDPANAGAVSVGVASHNLFEVAWALACREQAAAGEPGVIDRVEIEMLEGMAPATALAVRQVAGQMLLYAPIARRDDSESVIAYLVRRFDENTGPENFLRHQFGMTLG